VKLEKKLFGSVYVFKIKKHKDKRGHFSEIYNQKKISKYINEKFLIDAISFNKKNVIRGLHYQIKSKQAKLIYIHYGKIVDYIVDLRKKSKTYMKYKKITLSEKNNRMIYIPKNFAHGYYVLSNEAIIGYKLSNYHDKNFEKVLKWNSKNLKISLPKFLLKKKIMSKKDLF